MARDLELAAKLRRDPVLRPLVVEVAGWQTRGSSSFDPDGFVWHHTAGPLSGAAPSLAVCIYGRTGLAGPLCNVFLARDGKIYVVAAGRANHAGAGAWRGLRGNSRVYGLEVENTGYGTGPRAEPWSERILDLSARIANALVDDPADACHHKEWTTRKVDMHTVAGDAMRARVRALRAGAPTTPAPPADQEDEDEMANYFQSSVGIDAKGNIVSSGGDRPIFVFYGERFRRLTGTQWNRRRDLAAFGGRPLTLGQMHPWALAKFVIDYQLVEDPPTEKSKD